MIFKDEMQRRRKRILRRWSAPDYLGGSERFQIKLLARDIVVFAVLPIAAIVFFKVIEGAASPGSQKANAVEVINGVAQETKSQIISFATDARGRGSPGRRSPGTIVRLRLLNTVESLDGASAHAQVIDSSLGARFVGGVVVGDVVSDPSTSRVNVNFRFVRDPHNNANAIPIAARAMSLDGTAGVAAIKKEGFFARAALRAGSASGGNVNKDAGKQDFRTMVANAVAAGMVQELQDQATVQSKRAQVLTLPAGTEFFAELTDFFPASNQ